MGIRLVDRSLSMAWTAFHYRETRALIPFREIAEARLKPP
jgi:hypothetical protein